MNYSNIISDFTWSYSRISQFEMCPYAFLLRYILHAAKRNLFFSDYGTFMHKMIEMYLTGVLEKEELSQYYLKKFKSAVIGHAPNENIFKTYFEQGLQYFNNIDFPYMNLAGIEQRASFVIGDKPFVGIIDCIAKDRGEIIIVDNKSRALKARSARKKPSKSDIELDAYLRQLYMYSIPIKDKFHTYPSRLEFNCFRTGQLISEPFREEELEKTKQWALQSIDTITKNEDWSPKQEYWKCRYLCDCSHECEYFQMNNGR